MTKKSQRRARVAAGTRRVALAESELTAAMAELTWADRADKQIAGERLRSALAELVTARDSLARDTAAVN
ncbi:hypothetical protein [Nannocystis pusilla]|uniref:Uncharacterized protein n=1 Tax=Nannocystis pusilla TaxID=889268 RepID=A0ABS7TI68_9BACT|nr:hypothetical protein [Nannocystis pusilla]MBZ5707807.1 hypothetical protein [Nannocystis pusilla]